MCDKNEVKEVVPMPKPVTPTQRLEVLENTLFSFIDHYNDQIIEPGTPYAYKFKTSSCGLISLAEISEDVGRDLPVFEVVLEGAQYDQCHYLLVHESIILKSRLITATMSKMKTSKATKEFLSSIEKLLCALKEKCSNVVYYMDISSSSTSGFNLRNALKVIDKIREFPLHSLGFEPCKVVVRSR